MAHPRIGIVIGSTRPNRFGDKAATWIADIAAAQGSLAVEIVDLRDYPMPFFQEERSPAWAPSQDEVAQRWQRKVAELDGFIFTAAEYNHGPTAVLKNALDYAYNEWIKKPAGFVGYGGVGGARAIEQLRMHTIELNMANTKAAVHVNWGDFAQILQGGKALADFEHLNQAGAALVNEVAWWAKVLKEARENDARLRQAA
jgi:NAD(P)H-dependent FMN reductase